MDRFDTSYAVEELTTQPNRSFILKENLEIFLITYNRKKQLQATFDQILSADSPIKDLDISILDNSSVDGTSSLIREYARKFPNVTHVRHHRNIGGVANSIRPFEIVEKNYLWVLCDDDLYDWSNWPEVENAMANGEDLICVARYALADEDKEKIENQLLQLTFLPAGIYKTANFSDTTLRNAYDNIYTLLPQSCFAISLVNAGREIYVINKAIVYQAPPSNDVDASYTRGNNAEELSHRTRTMRWIVGYSGVCSMIKDTGLKQRALLAAIDFKDIHDGFENFCNCMCYWYPDRANWTHVLSVFLQLDENAQRTLLKRFMMHQAALISDEKILFDYFLTFGAEYENLFARSELPLSEEIARIFSIRRKSGAFVIWIMGRQRTPAQLKQYVRRKLFRFFSSVIAKSKGLFSMRGDDKC